MRLAAGTLGAGGRFLPREQEPQRRVPGPRGTEGAFISITSVGTPCPENSFLLVLFYVSKENKNKMLSMRR